MIFRSQTGTIDKYKRLHVPGPQDSAISWTFGFSVAVLKGWPDVVVAVGSPGTTYGTVWLLRLEHNGDAAATQAVTYQEGGLSLPIAPGARFGSGLASTGQLVRHVLLSAVCLSLRLTFSLHMSVCMCGKERL